MDRLYRAWRNFRPSTIFVSKYRPRCRRYVTFVEIDTRTACRNCARPAGWPSSVTTTVTMVYPVPGPHERVTATDTVVVDLRFASPPPFELIVIATVVIPFATDLKSVRNTTTCTFRRKRINRIPTKWSTSTTTALRFQWNRDSYWLCMRYILNSKPIVLNKHGTPG
jgi:hypothetical protein